MKYIDFNIFQNALKWLPICYCIKYFVLTKHVAICNCVILSWWFVHRNSVLIKLQPNATVCRYFFCKITLHVSGVTAPIIRILKTVTATSNTGHVNGVCDSHKPVPIRPRCREVAVPVLWPVLEAAVTV